MCENVHISFTELLAQLHYLDTNSTIIYGSKMTSLFVSVGKPSWITQ